MMHPTTIHKWFTTYGIDPMIGWEVVEIAHDNEFEVENETMLFDSCHRYICVMLESVSDEPDNPRLDYFLKYLIPMIRSLAPHFTNDQVSDIEFAADADTPLIQSAVRVTLTACRS